MLEYTFTLEEISPLEFFGVNNIRFRQLKEAYPSLMFVARGDRVKIRGEETAMAEVRQAVSAIINAIKRYKSLPEERFQEILAGKTASSAMEIADEILVYGPNGILVKPKTEGQREIVTATQQNDIVFALGPAGTGKTYTAVALAVKALKEKQVKKIFLVRPAVEAGETLGFLPGDLKEKVDPYLRPLYDALEDMIQGEKLKHYLDSNLIEIAPLAYMRGRTLNKAYVILDEAQNATEMQFKMFLTRLGRGSKIIITGDDSQIDLPRNQRSGLLQTSRILRDIPGIAFVRLSETDVVRHKLVKKIIAAYKTEDENKNNNTNR